MVRRPRDFDAGEVPLAVNCELVSTYDLACPMCYTTTEEFKTAVAGSQRMIPWPIARAIIDEAAELGVPFLALSWRGESTFYRWRDGKETITFPDVLAYARTRGILEIMSLTHGQRIDEAIVDAAPNWISVSMDGIHENYDKIRSPVKKRDGNKSPFTMVV